MFVSFLIEFAKAKPLQVQRQNAMLGITDATLLLELVGVSGRTVMAGKIQNSRELCR